MKQRRLPRVDHAQELYDSEARRLTARLASAGRVQVKVGGYRGPYGLVIRYLDREQLDRVAAAVLRELGLEPAGRTT